MALAQNMGMSKAQAAQMFRGIADDLEPAMAFVRDGGAGLAAREAGRAQDREAALLNAVERLNRAAEKLPAGEYNRICELFEQGAIRRSSNPNADFAAAYNIVQDERAARERADAARAKRASRSISGDASGDHAGFPGGRRRGRSHDLDVEADTRAAYARVAGNY
jgi:hypothetical protein